MGELKHDRVVPHVKVGMSVADAQELLACDIPQWFRDSLSTQVSEAYAPQYLNYCTFCMAAYKTYKCRGHK